ncbi:endonuclease NucS domain-containing protein [Nodosilinea sp. FACHB-13]|uniref:endonuclease NucS domain-containing protein n=1 Tax=Cyanophyceae TaxID=3028117 RepID=UPI00168851C6|nr:endonuclease NucS domain-containing protein [Nodosilinea sp. FACHB-13]MBD2110030.1 DUF91 domain-containing protein [Nodosilinea sp. FACHB-13]
MADWAFHTEFDLEEFVWANLKPLLDLKPLARQYIIEGQICDILATTSKRQLVVLELKNVEDRYVVQQLTRYYASLRHAQPFADQVDYSLPIRLIALSPTFHAHNHIDREHSRLDFEFYQFTIAGADNRFNFQIASADLAAELAVEVDPKFYPFLRSTEGDLELTTSTRVVGRPPKSLRTQLEQMTPERAELVSALRLQILEFDERMREVGRSTRTQYGLAKGEKDVYKTKLCAEFFPPGGFNLPALYLMLPYAKKEFGAPGHRYKQERVKGLAWAGISLWSEEKTVTFYLGKSRAGLTQYHFTYGGYAKLCDPLLGYRPQFESVEDLVALALAEWKQVVGE